MAGPDPAGRPGGGRVGAPQGVGGIEPIVRSTERMVLRGLVESDLDEYARVLHVSRETWTPWTPAADQNASPADLFRRELERARAGARAGTHVRLGAFEHGGPLVGVFALNEIVRGVFQSAHASWQVSGDRVGRGFGTEGVRALLDIAFDGAPGGLSLHRVQANIMPSNAPSLRIADKVGFRREGEALRYLRIAGRWQDHLMFAITSEEWPVPA